MLASQCTGPSSGGYTIFRDDGTGIEGPPYDNQEGQFTYDYSAGKLAIWHFVLDYDPNSQTYVYQPLPHYYPPAVIFDVVLEGRVLKLTRDKNFILFSEQVYPKIAEFGEWPWPIEESKIHYIHRKL